MVNPWFTYMINSSLLNTEIPEEGVFYLASPYISRYLMSPMHCTPSLYPHICWELSSCKLALGGKPWEPDPDLQELTHITFTPTLDLLKIQFNEISINIKTLGYGCQIKQAPTGHGFDWMPPKHWTACLFPYLLAYLHTCLLSCLPACLLALEPPWNL